MARSTQTLPAQDEISEETLSLVWRNPAPLSGAERRARAEQVSAQMPPQLTDSVALIREDRDVFPGHRR